jgi:hypothetical protein
MIWTISYNGTEKPLADWGFINVTRSLRSQGLDMLSFKADGSLADAPVLFTPFGPSLTLYRNRTQLGNGSFTGGMPWFAGIVTQIPRAGSPAAEAMQYKVAGPWWYLENLVFQQPFNAFAGYTIPNDPTSPPLFVASESDTHLFLNLAPVNAPTITGKINTGQQILEALNWALKPFITAAVTPPFQIGTVTPALDVPIDEARDITCAEVIHKMLRWSPDAVTWFDYTTSPPTFNCKRRSELT